MSNRRASISANLRADATQWKKGCDAARAATMKLKRDVEATRINGPNMKGAVGSIAGGFREINARATAVKNVVQAVATLAAKPLTSNTSYQDLKDGLTAVMGSAEKAKEHISQLRLISDEYNATDIGFEKMIDASERMQTLGYSAEFAADFIREASNAAEFMGKAFEDMEPVFNGLDKIDNHGKDSALALGRLTQSIPAFRRVMQDAFGTSTAHELEALDLSAKQLTEGILAGMKQIETVSTSLGEDTAGIFDRSDQWLGADSEDNNGTLKPRSVISPEKGAAAREALLAGQRKKAAAAEKAAQDEQNVTALEAVRIAGIEAISQDTIAQARADGNEAAARAIEDRLAADNQIAAAAEKYKVSQELITDQIREQVEEHRKAVNAMEKAAALGDFAEKKKALEIETLRAKGKDKKANQLEDGREIADLTKSGVGHESAAWYVQQKRRNADDDARAAAGLRPRMHGRGKTGDGGRSKAGDSVNSDGGMQGGLGGFHSERFNFTAALRDEGIPYFDKGRQHANPIGVKALTKERDATVNAAQQALEILRTLSDSLIQIRDNTRATPAQKHASRK